MILKDLQLNRNWGSKSKHRYQRNGAQALLENSKAFAIPIQNAITSANRTFL